MREFSIREMRACLGRLARVVEEAGEVIVTRQGRAIARVVAVAPRKTRPDYEDLRSRMPRLATSSADLVRKERDER
ncbi:MAG: type II toxin-antitoxin system Phd/YefM family antitoxin [Gammaproteobacteria bacterium]|nr:type II toxin-antitoxin system Phd/YefM family antitoxin [Gammaproteobacteria bacterium]